MKKRTLEVYASTCTGEDISEILSPKCKRIRGAYSTMSVILNHIAKDYSDSLLDLVLTDVPHVYELVGKNPDLVQSLCDNYKDLFVVLNKRSDPEHKLATTDCPELRDEISKNCLVDLLLDTDNEGKIKGIKSRVSFLEHEDNLEQKDKINDYLNEIRVRMSKYGFAIDEKVLNTQGYSSFKEVE